jgi:hypothetical protein
MRRLSASLILATTIYSQAPELALDRAGQWKVKPVRWASEVPAGARPRITQAINDVVAALRRTPALAQPKGFDVDVDLRAEWHDLDTQYEGKRPMYAGIRIAAELTAYTKGAPPQATRPVIASIEILVNDLSLFAGWEAGHGVAAADAGARFLTDPPEPVEMRGAFPVYHDSAGRDRYIVLTRAKVPLFAPVPRERYLQFEIEETRKVTTRQMAEMKPPPSNDPQVLAAWKEAQKRMAEITQTFNEGKAHYQAQFDGMNRQLAAMSAEDRHAATFLSNPNPTDDGTIEFLQRSDSDAKAVVYRNPALMDDRLPPGTPQILTIRFETSDEWPELAPKLEEELDWPALEKIVTAP